jgi:DHA2 family multidrug resistance protein
MNAQMNAQVGFDQLLWAQIIRGVGLVLCIVPITQVALGTLPRDEVGGGSGLFNLFRNMGGAMGLAMINTGWDGRYDRHYWWLVEGLSNTSAAVQNRLNGIAGALSDNGVLTADPQTLALHQLSRQVSQQASIMAWDDIFWLMAVAFAVAMPLVFLLAKPQAGKVAAH